VINHLVKEGYKVINVSKEKNPFDNCTQIEDYSMDNTINTIHYSEFTICLSSGLGWLSWALEKKIIMIAGFTTIGHEFQCIRPYNDKVCHGCWNKSEFKFDRGDWSWCPLNKDTPNQFICQRSITAEMVINEIKKLIERR
jgi:autotransporter strand-loop-strand O-heptosyltransferase